MKCEDCNWWEPIGTTNADGKWTQSYDNRRIAKGQCRLRAPSASAKDYNLWPSTTADASCGEFQPQLEKHRNLWQTQCHVYNNRLRVLRQQVWDCGQSHGISRRKKPKTILKELTKPKE